MELALIIALILIFEFAAARWGADSRDLHLNGFDTVDPDLRD